MIIILLKGSVPTDWQSFRFSAGLSENAFGILLLFVTEFSQQCQNSAQHASGGTESVEVSGDGGRRPQGAHPTPGLQTGQERDVVIQKVLLCPRVQVLETEFYFAERRGWCEHVRFRRGIHGPGHVKVKSADWLCKSGRSHPRQCGLSSVL